jgi:hypothetical protein
VALAHGEEKLVALVHGEEETMESFRGSWGARPSSLYSACASRRPKFEARDSAIARGILFFSRAGLASPLEERGRVPACSIAGNFS